MEDQQKGCLKKHQTLPPTPQHWATGYCLSSFWLLSVKSKYTQWEKQCEAALSGPRSATHSWDFRQVLYPPWKASSALTVTTCPGNITFLSRNPQHSTKHFHRFDVLHLNQVKCAQKMDTLGCESFEKLPGLQTPEWWSSYLQPPFFKLPHLQNTASSAQQFCRDRHLSGQGEEVMGKEEEIMTKKPLGVCSETFNSNLQTSNTTID